MSIDPTPHRAYIAAVAADLGYVDLNYADPYAVTYEAEREADGLLTATVSYSLLGKAVPPGPLGGLTLRWNQRAGWRSVPTSSPGAPETPLLVPVLASPAAIRQKLPALLEGRTHELVESTQQWPLIEAHRRLIGRLDVVEELARVGWKVFSGPESPVCMNRGSVIWRLTGFTDTWWESDWRDSTLSAPLWSTRFSVEVPADIIVAAALAAVERAAVPDDRPPRLPVLSNTREGA